LSYQWLTGSQLQLQWPQGALLEATNLNGPWITNNAASPFYLSPTGLQKYFRARIL